MEGVIAQIIPSPLKNIQSRFIGSSSPATSYNEHLNEVRRRPKGIDKVTLSQASRDPQEDSSSPERVPGTSQSVTSGLNSSEQNQLRQLKARDLEVRTHEQAHLAAAGQYAASGSSFTYQRGPDGNRYAVGGEVQIDIGKEPTPEETIQKMEVIARAALAPANPSPADRQIAAQAAMKASRARQEILQQGQEESDAAQSKEENTEISQIPDNDNPSTPKPLDPDVAGSATLKKAMIESYQAIQAMGS
jgi:hypothetical protein